MLNQLAAKYAAAHGFKDYTELRAQKNTQKVVGLLNGSMISNTVASVGGVSARVYKNGAYGFASSPDYTEESLKSVVAAATENAEFLDGRQKLCKPAFTPVKAFTQPLNYAKEDATSQKQIIEFLSQLDAHIAEKYPKLQSRYVVAPVLNMEKLLITSDGVVSHNYAPRSNVMVQFTMNGTDGAPVELFEAFGGFGNFDDWFTDPSKLYEKLETLYKQICDKASAVYAEAGLKDCVMHPSLAGILAHEAVGHTVEADFVHSGSVGGPYLNKRVASDLITMVDFANTAMGKQTNIPVYVDDEGTPARDAMLIENGILKGYMHNKESALSFGVEPTGNARAYQFSDEPLIRMRNTAILPGSDKLEDMISAVDDGYYLMNTGNGQADATGEFMFGVTMGYEIKHGKLGRAIKDTTVSGVAFEMLKTVDMVSDDIQWSASGMCGKKQMIPVSMGGPSLKCKINIGGR